MGTENFKTITENRKARHEYFVLESMETGIELVGTEVKSLRQGQVNLKDSWCSIDNYENLFLVDTNGFTPPNQFGKDRFVFTFGNSKGERTYQSSDYAKIIPYAKDTSSATYYCKHPPCYYYSWLYN